MVKRSSFRAAAMFAAATLVAVPVGLGTASTATAPSAATSTPVTGEQPCGGSACLATDVAEVLGGVAVSAGGSAQADQNSNSNRGRKKDKKRKLHWLIRFLRRLIDGDDD